MVNDSISDMLTRIRNACLAKKSSVYIPYTKLNEQIAQILEKEGFIQAFQISFKTSKVNRPPRLGSLNRFSSSSLSQSSGNNIGFRGQSGASERLLGGRSVRQTLSSADSNIKANASPLPPGGRTGTGSVGDKKTSLSEFEEKGARKAKVSAAQTVNRSKGPNVEGLAESVSQKAVNLIPPGSGGDNTPVAPLPPGTGGGGGEPGQEFLLIRLKYRSKQLYKGKKKESCITNLRRISKTGLRIYTNHKEIPRILGGAGIVIISTPEGIMTDREARSRGIGGEVLCSVW
jgi:ribosomal protein S8